MVTDKVVGRYEGFRLNSVGDNSWNCVSHTKQEIMSYGIQLTHVITEKCFELRSGALAKKRPPTRGGLVIWCPGEDLNLHYLTITST